MTHRGGFVIEWSVLRMSAISTARYGNPPRRTLRRIGTHSRHDWINGVGCVGSADVSIAFRFISRSFETARECEMVLVGHALKNKINITLKNTNALRRMKTWTIESIFYIKQYCEVRFVWCVHTVFLAFVEYCETELSHSRQENLSLAIWSEPYLLVLTPLNPSGVA